MPNKSAVSALRGVITKLEKHLASLEKVEAKVRGTWTKLHHRFIDASETLANLTRRGTKREAKLKEVVRTFRERSQDLTDQRNAARAEIDATKALLEARRLELERLLAEDRRGHAMTDEIVEQTFALNDRVVEASRARADYLTQHVFALLVDERGNLRSQVTFDHTDGKRRVRAMVNQIQLVRPDMAADAMELIQSFFDRFQSDTMDDSTRALFELTRRLLVLKTSFKIGPDLYRFLMMDLSEELFPELVKAQRLLKQSLRTEKTNAYVRLSVRDDVKAPWRPIPQH